MPIADMHVWYFDSGASKHTTSHHDLFSSLEIVLVGNSFMCAKNSLYPVKGVGNIQLAATNGSTFVLMVD